MPTFCNSQNNYKGVNVSELNKLFNECKENIYHECEVGLKFSFAFALYKICSECHGGQRSELYALMSALSIEWQFEQRCSGYDSYDFEQFECFEFLIDKLNVRKLYANEVENDIKRENNYNQW